MRPVQKLKALMREGLDDADRRLIREIYCKDWKGGEIMGGDKVKLKAEEATGCDATYSGQSFRLAREESQGEYAARRLTKVKRLMALLNKHKEVAEILELKSELGL